MNQCSSVSSGSEILLITTRVSRGRSHPDSTSTNTLQCSWASQHQQRCSGGWKLCAMCTQGGVEEQRLHLRGGTNGTEHLILVVVGTQFERSEGWDLGSDKHVTDKYKKIYRKKIKAELKRLTELERWRHTEKLRRWVFSVSNVVSGCSAGKTLVATRREAEAKQQQQQQQQHNFTL